MIRDKLLLIATASAVTFGFLSVAYGAEVSFCTQSYSEAIDKLAEEHAEFPVAVYADDGIIKTLLGTEDGARWSLLYSATDGKTCTARNGNNIAVVK